MNCFLRSGKNSWSKWAQWGHWGAAYSTMRIGAFGDPIRRSHAVRVTVCPAFESGTALSEELLDITYHVAPPSAIKATTINPKIRVFRVTGDSPERQARAFGRGARRVQSFAEGPLRVRALESASSARLR